MPSILANPFSIPQVNDAVRNAIISWQKGARIAEEAIMDVRSLFYEKGAAQRTEEYSNFSDSGFSSKTGEGEDYMLTSTTQGDSLTLTQVKRTSRRKITEDFLRFTRYPELNAILQNVGGDLWRGYALDLCHRFTFAFDTSYTDRDGETVTTTGGDAAAFIADTHTLNNGDTFDNKITARLSEASLEDIEDLGHAFCDHNGQLVTVRFDTLVTGTHAATRHMAQRLIGQEFQVDSDFRNMGAYKGQFRHVVLPYLDTTAAGLKDTTKSRYWFAMDSSKKQNLISSVNLYPDLDPVTRDTDNNTLQFKGKMYYDIGLLDSNWAAGANAS